MQTSISKKTVSKQKVVKNLELYLKKMKNALKYRTEELWETPVKPFQMQLSWHTDDAPRTLLRQRAPKPSRKVVQTSSRFDHPPLPLPYRVNESETAVLERRIQAHMRGKLELTITDNRTSIISVKRLGVVFKVRLHHMFLNADPRVLRSLGRYIEKADSESSLILEQYIEKHSHLIRESAPSIAETEIRTKGSVHDLQEIFTALNRRYFANRIQAVVTWGKPITGAPRHHRSAKMGTYSVEDRIIQIHPALDRPFVPRYFVESVMYHEMLHQVYGAPVINGRHQYHSPDFLASERRFEHYQLARQWERENINRLLYF